MRQSPLEWLERTGFWGALWPALLVGAGWMARSLVTYLLGRRDVAWAEGEKIRQELRADNDRLLKRLEMAEERQARLEAQIRTERLADEERQRTLERRISELERIACVAPDCPDRRQE